MTGPASGSSDTAFPTAPRPRADRPTSVLAAAPSPPDAGDPLAPGSFAGSWRIAALIAEGGCGTVYAARHPVLDRPAAVKVLHAGLARSPSMVDRFVREARAVNQIRHPGIVDIFDFGTLPDGRPFFVMELLAADDLDRRVATGGRLVIAEVMAIMAPICRALGAVHRAGYVHRDLKAHNIGFAVTADGVEVPKLLDFGVAKLLEDERGATGTIRVGTPHCMAPEQIRGERVDARTDIYALGVLLHHLLTGRYPFDAGDPLEIERLHLEAPPPAPSRLAPVPPALDALVLRALSKSPAARPGSALELLALLTAAADAAPPAPVAPARRDAIAIAIRVELELPEPVADDDLDDTARAAERAVTLLGQRGFTPVLVTATSVLAARVIDGPAAEGNARAVAAALERTLASRPGARGAFTTRIAVQTGEVEVARDTGALIGGPLLELHTWPR